MRQDMQEKAADEFMTEDRQDFGCIRVFAVAVAKRYAGVGGPAKPIVGDGDPVCVAPEVLQNPRGAAVKGGLRIDDPSLVAQALQEVVKGRRRCRLLAAIQR
jgi:hypothetical protein